MSVSVVTTTIIDEFVDIINNKDIRKFIAYFPNLTIDDLAKQDHNLDTLFHISIRKRFYYANLKLFWFWLSRSQQHLQPLLLKNSDNQTPLELALEMNDMQIVKKLLMVPEIVNYLDDGMTILMKLISQRNDDQVIKILKMNNSIDHSIVGKFGTSFHMTITFCAYGLADVFLELPNVQDFINIRTHENRTALNIAIMDEASDIAVKIFKHGGNLVTDEFTLKQMMNSEEIKINILDFLSV